MNSNFLEDNWYDVVCKASSGLGVKPEALIHDDLCEEKPPSEDVLSKIAQILNLDPASLIALSKCPAPPAVSPPDNLVVFTSCWHTMLVNSYLLRLDDGKAVLFDTGTDASAIKNFLKDNKLSLEHIFITHNHRDHIACLKDIAHLVDDQNIWSSENEYLEGTSSFKPGKTWQLGDLSIESRLTNGHSIGGTTYVLNHYSTIPSLAIVGDAIFAWSMGGGKVDYHSAIKSNLKEIITLPEDCIICPGHGALSTVGMERAHNPFLIPHI